MALDMYEMGKLEALALEIASREWDYDYWQCAFCHGRRKRATQEEKELKNDLIPWTPLEHRPECPWLRLRKLLGLPDVIEELKDEIS